MINLLKNINTKYGKDIFFFCVLIIFFIQTLSNLPADPDLWGYLSFGKLFWETSGFPYVDVFSYLPVKNEWIYHEWLTGVIYYPIYSVFNGTGLQLLRYLLLIATLFTVFVTARMRGGSSFSVFIIMILLGGYLKIGYSPVRAQIFTYLFFSIYLFMLENYRHNNIRGSIYLLIPLQIIWSNLHGGYLAGLGLLFIYNVSAYIIGASGRKRITLVFILCVLSTLLTPYGLAYWKYTYHAVTMSRSNIPEWWSIVSALKEGYLRVPSIWMLITAIVVGFVVAWQRKINIYELSVLLVTFILSLSSIRHILFFLLSACALTPAMVNSLVRNRTNLFTHKLSKVMRELSSVKMKKEVETIISFSSVLIVISIFMFYDIFTLNIPKCSPEIGERFCYPVSAVEFIKNKKYSGNVLTVFEWGEYLIWEIYPSCKVALYGRYETVYANWLCEKYFNFIDGKRGWRNFLNQFPPDMILLPSKKKISSLIRDEGNWDVALEKSGIVLFIRRKQPLHTDYDDIDYR